MPINVSYDLRCDANFRYDYETEFNDWFNLEGHDTFDVDTGTVVFDQAYVLNGLHPTTSQYDPNPVPHVTVRLSNEELRQQNSWLDTEEANNQRRQKRKDKKKRQQERKKDLKDRKDKDGKGAGGSASTSGSRAKV